MFQNLEIFQLSHAMARHAARRQELVAANMANADTPGYGARDLTPFSKLVERRAGEYGMRTTRAGHFDASARYDTRPVQTNVENAPNGNGISLEEEMLRAVEVRRQHNRALAIYKSSLGILRTSLGRR